MMVSLPDDTYAADVEYLVSRDRDLLSIGSDGRDTIIAAEGFLHIVRSRARSG
jgi:hypothetical protein